MKIKPFKVEEWMNEYEDDAVYNIAVACVDSISISADWHRSQCFFR